MKRFATLLLALIMVMSMATTAFAAEKGSITVENPLANQTYTAYKIFDVTYDGENYSYTIDSSSEWFSVVNTYATEANGMTLTQVNGTTTYNVTTTDKFSAGNFSTVLKTAVSGKTGTDLTVADGKATATGLDLGYYFVTSTAGALCNLTTTDSAAIIRDKNDMPFDKVVEDKSVEVGQTVNYTINGKVPDTTGCAEYTYKVTDVMSEGLTFNKDVKVTINGTDVTNKCTIDYTSTANGFTLSIPVMDYQENIGDAIIITYTAKVNEKAVSVISKNQAKLEYTNNPDGTTTSTPVDEETVYSAKIVIDKYETGAESTKLEGAKFVLYKEVGGAKSYYKYDATTQTVSWVADKAQATVKTTDEKGAAEFIGLEDGTYYLEETEAPAGYNKLTAPVEVTIAGSNSDASKLTVTSKIANNTGSELPETGGMGTTMFYVIGGFLMMAAVVLLVTKKRMASAE